MALVNFALLRFRYGFRPRRRPAASPVPETDPRVESNVAVG